MKDVFAFWGCGNGFLKSLQPYARILSAVLVGIACLLVPLRAINGQIFILVVTLCWVLLALMPWKMLFRCAIASVVLFFPFLLLSPWMTIDSYSSSPVTDRIVQAGNIAMRSTCMLFIALSTIASLSMHDIHRGLVCLPIPRSIIALIVQLINQTMLLVEETIRIAGILRLRGATGVRGTRALFAFPVVWMVRMLFRAERSAAAMAVRGYGIESAAKGDRIKMKNTDLLILCSASLALVISVIMLVKTYL
ncbi:MAG: hypothetical protein GX556_14555 [Fibrobacter sp.]|nr:hypothetical protein [Fibrobacter sp.]